MHEPRNQLRSWKNIAGFLDADERTVRRWERTRRLPVHRVGGRERDAVFANIDELEAWVAAGKNGRPDEEPCSEPGDLQPIGDVSRIEDAALPGVPTVRIQSHSRIRQTLVVAGAIAVIGVAVAVALQVRGGFPVASTGSGSAPLASKATPDAIPAAPTGAASVLVLRFSKLDGTAVELALPEGVSGRVGGGANSPALLVTARLADAGLRMEIRRADGQPVKPGGSPGRPLALLLQRGVSVRVLNPYAFDLEWVRTEAPNAQR
jgi:hypothetical protein